ncbi:Cytoplasmic dynein 2 light intermediate chain 1 [Boothiomyces macroporosus]|uniref:Cytoplasmic dynein 2 light intermediate chain 1 n=1 Tax=Boothiomyces macroporosus TaxID=261099 RepID=A0AAD5UJ35_9FUNG|nr:Cytoplasmic dynein 2 light intermediate chain 1 [Boothiomyces macroporosus]
MAVENEDWGRSSTNINDTSPKARSTKDIWTMVKDLKDREKKPVDSNDVAIETLLLFAGSSGCGKTSIINRFLDKDETPSPSVGLEYTFGRRTRKNETKDITHIYELAGGVNLSNLLDIPICESNIHTSSLILCVDLSKPEEILDILDHFIEKIKARTNFILDRLEARGSKRPQALRNYAMKRYGAEHPDEKLVSPIPIPTLIIGTFYDKFSVLESEPKKLLCKTLRYIAHLNGASLVFNSIQDENLNAKCRQILTHMAFRGSPPKSFLIDHNKPLLVMAGQDTFSQIGPPPSEFVTDAVGKQQFVSYEKWKADYYKYFPRAVSEIDETFVNLNLYPELVIDNLRLEKDRELEKLRLNIDRQSKDKDINSGISNLLNSKEKKKSKSYSRAR